MVDITLIGVASGFVLIASLIYYSAWIRNIARDKYESFLNRRTSELVSGIFSPEVDVDIIEDFEEYGDRISAAAERSTRIYRISGNAATFPTFDEEDTFSNPGIQNRILISAPEFSEQVDDSDRESTGLDAIRESPYVDTQHSRETTHEKVLLQFKNKIDNGDWDIEVRLYRTVPWFRGVIFSDEAGIMMSPNLYDFRDVSKFWVKNEATCKILRMIFDDIWNDPETMTLDEWFTKHEEG